MRWVSVSKLKTVCEAIKNYAIEQGDDVYNKIDVIKVNIADEMTEAELTTLTNLFS